MVSYFAPKCTNCGNEEMVAWSSHSYLGLNSELFYCSVPLNEDDSENFILLTKIRYYWYEIFCCVILKQKNNYFLLAILMINISTLICSKD